MTTYLEYSLTISSAPADSKLNRKTSNVGVDIRNPQAHVSFSLTDTCQLCLVSLKTGRKSYMEVETGQSISDKLRLFFVAVRSSLKF